MKGLQRSLSRGPKSTARIVKATIPLVNVLVNVAAAGAGIGFGGTQVSQLPEGNILLLGSVLDAVITESSANIVDTGSGDISVGTTPPNDGTLTVLDVNILASTPMGPLVASAFTFKGSNVVQAQIDNTAAPTGIYLNALIDAADIADGTNGDLIFNGTLTVSYQVMGDT